MKHFDIIIRNGIIVDGTGKDKYKSDIGIIGDTIVEINDFSAKEDVLAERYIDAKGAYISPGFIDPHSHNDLNLLIWPENEANVLQGITTAISGNCGFSPAPIKEDIFFSGWEYKISYEITKEKYKEAEFIMNRDSMKKALKEAYNFDLDYETLGEFFCKSKSDGFSVNYYPFVGHNNIRLEAMGRDCFREATKEEIEKMKVILRREMEAGARGLSTGLDYPPGAYSTTEELIELSKVAKEYNGTYISHVRSMKLYLDKTESLDPDIMSGIRELIRIGKETGIRVHVAHVLPAFQISRDDSYEKKRESVDCIIELFNNALKDGVDISYDVIPNTSGGGVMISNLAYLLKPWVLENSSVKELLKKLEDKEYEDYVKKDMKECEYAYANKNLITNLDDMFVIIKCSEESFQGNSIRRIMRMKNWEYEDAIINILRIDPETKMKFDVGSPEECLEILLDHPNAIPSSDGFSYNLDSNPGLSDELSKLPHPNNFCYIIRYLTLYKKDRIEDSIRQITSYPAERFNIPDRGIIREGFKADIVIFNEDKLKTNENFIDSRQIPEGIDYVIINGQLTGELKKHLGTKAGRII